jgi:hypothetical protein
VPDDLDARLVILPSEYTYIREEGNAAETAAKAILESRGNSPRLYRNTLVFLAADKARLQDLDLAIRKYLAWESIVAEQETLDLGQAQRKQAETQKRLADSTVTARLPETYQWVLVPEQITPSAPVHWVAIKVSGSDSLAARVSKKLRTDERLILILGSTILRKALDEIPLWRDEERVSVRQLVDDYARYLYLPRLVGPEVLIQAIRDGVALLTWQKDTFAFAESFDDKEKRYRGVRAGQIVTVDTESVGLLVRPTFAARQLEVDTQAPPDRGGDTGASSSLPHPEFKEGLSDKGARVSAAKPRRYYGSVPLDSVRAGRDAARIAEEVISHLVGQPGADIKVTLEIEARIPSGASEQTVRTVTENSRALKFSNFGFEEE